ncbi:MAG: hypothetical protein R3E87_13955 [Burkholderiaceae bacterium]
MNKKIVAIPAISLALLVTGCRTANPVMNLESVPVQASSRLTTDQVYKTIADAGSSLGWIIRKEAPGHAVGTLSLREHRAVVDITYDSTSYSIRYKDSENLKYDSAKNTIHPNYNGWVTNLNKSIATRLAAK